MKISFIFYIFSPPTSKKLPPLAPTPANKAYPVQQPQVVVQQPQIVYVTRPPVYPRCYYGPCYCRESSLFLLMEGASKFQLLSSFLNFPFSDLNTLMMQCFTYLPPLNERNFRIDWLKFLKFFRNSREVSLNSKFNFTSSQTTPTAMEACTARIAARSCEGWQEDRRKPRSLHPINIYTLIDWSRHSTSRSMHVHGLHIYELINH